MMVTKEQVIENPEEFMGIWIEQNLSKYNRTRIEGCALAIEIFGNHNPFANSKIYSLDCMEKFKDIRKQKQGQKGGKTHPIETKKDYLKKLSKLPKSKLKEIVDESESTSMLVSETLSTLTKEY